MDNDTLRSMKLDELISRINELSKKNRTSGLTEEETAERAELRREYVRRFHESLRAELENVYYVGGDGAEHKLEKKETGGK